MTDESKPLFPQEFLDKLNSVKNKRARIVIEHILQHGSISTQELKELYGYNHPPRAAKDVRDEGIPLQTFTIKGADGRSIAAYRFGDPATVTSGREGGRKNFSKRFKRVLYQRDSGRCSICNGQFAERELQIDHCVPYEIGGDTDEPDQHPEKFMLVCGSCNRVKSWSCEHCPNWLAKDHTVCTNCYWANPLVYQHVATKHVRRAEIIWEDAQELDLHEKIQQAAKAEQVSIQEYMKALLRNVTLLMLPLVLILILLFFIHQVTADE
ncbi:MAG: hypothetical protein R3E79_27390 [Caldilineaceae bacterium]